MAVRPQDLVFYAGGECLEKYGVLVKRTSPGEEIVETYTRTGTPQIADPNGKLIKVAANVPPVEWVDGAPLLLLEAGLTNLVDEDDLTAWGTSGTPVVTGSQSDPAGGSAAFTVEDDDAISVEFIKEEVALTGDGAKAVVFVVKENTMPGVGDQALLLYDTTLGSVLNLRIDGWVSGEPTITEDTGTLLDKWQLGTTGWWALACQTISVTAANTFELRIYPTATANQTGSLDVYRVNAYDSAVPLTSILDASDVLGDALFSYPFPFPPQDLWGYVKMRPRMLANLGVAWWRGVQVGDSDDGQGIVFYFDKGTDILKIKVRDADGDSQYSDISTTPAIDDSVEVRFFYDHSAGTVQGWISIAGATEVAGTLSSAVDSLTLFTGATIYIGADNSGANIGFAAYDAVKVVLDPEGRDYTLDELGDVS